MGSRKIYFSRFAMVYFVMTITFSARAEESLVQIYQNSVSRVPVVVFTARSGVPGHAFVAVGEELDNGLLFELGVYGFYPKDGKKVVLRALFGTDGEVDHRWKDMQRDVWFLHKISNVQLEQVLVVLKNWREEKYSLLGNNCNSLAKEVAKVSGLKIPKDDPGVTLPVTYITKLQSLNH